MIGKVFKYQKDLQNYRVIGLAYDTEIDNIVVVFKAVYDNPEFDMFTMSESNFKTRFEEIDFNPLS